jgi:hypothetical protein
MCDSVAVPPLFYSSLPLNDPPLVSRGAFVVGCSWIDGYGYAGYNYLLST